VLYQRFSAVPSGLIVLGLDPALKRRAILNCPYGTNRNLSPDVNRTCTIQYLPGVRIILQDGSDTKKPSLRAEKCHSRNTVTLSMAHFANNWQRREYFWPSGRRGRFIHHRFAQLVYYYSSSSDY
jgi:hypothetical protein